MKLCLNSASLFVFCARNLARTKSDDDVVSRIEGFTKASAPLRLRHNVKRRTRGLLLRASNEDDIEKGTQMDGDEAKTLPNDHVFDVIIVGAGWAGIAAANLLAKRGINNIRILEAKDHIGGRAYSVNHHWESKSIPLDMGAMWIHGASKNIMNRLALNYDVETHMSTYSTRIYKEDNQGPFEEEEVESYREQIYQDGFFPFQAARQESTECDEPLQKSADLFVDQLNSPFEQQLARLFLKSSIEIEYSGLLRDHSLWWWNDDYDLGGTIEFDDYFVPEGHNSLIGPFASQLLSDHKIQLEAPVQTIDYQSKDLIEVSYNNKDGNDNLARTRKVIVTVPLGVLKAESITFVPRLPRWAQRSIRRLGMGKMNKVFLFWSSDNVFWPYDTEILGDITERDSNFLFCNPRPYNGNLPMLFAFFQGPTADRLEEEYAESDPVMYKDRIRDLAMESLRSMFGDDIPMPQKVVVTQWNVDEYTGGAYSFNQVGMGRHDRHLLAQPIGRNQIFIAGEATHSRYFATTTGAFLTGRAAARKAIQALQKD